MQDSTSVRLMQDPSVMPEKIKALLDSEGATDIVVSEYAPMTGGYSRLMARFEASFTYDGIAEEGVFVLRGDCLLYTSPSPRDRQKSRMPSSA